MRAHREGRAVEHTLIVERLIAERTVEPRIIRMQEVRIAKDMATSHDGKMEAGARDVAALDFGVVCDVGVLSTATQAERAEQQQRELLQLLP
jgi:hypothetical protein